MNEPLAPLHPTYEERMVEAIRAVEAILPGYTIALLVAPPGSDEGRRVNYISSGRREDMQAMMKEMLARWEGRAHDAPKRSQ